MFQKARRTDAHLRLALVGPAGSGKTFSALRIAHGLGLDGRIAVIDTEHASSNLYADAVNPDGGTFDFDVLDLAAMPGRSKYEVEKYLKALKMAQDAGYPIVIIDSLSHAWEGEGGILDLVARKAGAKNQAFQKGWRDATPVHNKLVNALLTYPGHVVVTLRTKTAYDMQRNEHGKMEPVKVGLQPIQRNGLDYEFTVVADLEQGGELMKIGKTRCAALRNETFESPGADFAGILRRWLDGASEPIAPPPAPPPEPKPKHETWRADQGRYFAILAENGIDHEKLKAVLARRGHASPSTWMRKQRDGLLEQIENGKVYETLGVTPDDLAKEVPDSGLDSGAQGAPSADAASEVPASAATSLNGITAEA